MRLNSLPWKVVTATLFGTALVFSQADERAVAAVGSFSARKGVGGTVLQAGYYFSLEADQIYEMGGDVQYRELKTTVFDVPHVRVTVLSIPGTISLKLRKPPFVPYVGAGVVLGIASFDKAFVESRRPGLTIQNTSVNSFGAFLAGGLRIELESAMLFFAECRYGWDSFATDLNGMRQSVDLGGAWILGGIGLRF